MFAVYLNQYEQTWQHGSWKGSSSLSAVVSCKKYMNYTPFYTELHSLVAELYFKKCIIIILTIYITND